MKKYSHALCLLALLCVSLPCAAQGFGVFSGKPPSVASVSQPFVSLDGRFTIALPDAYSFQPIVNKTPAGKVTGEFYSWTTAEGQFAVAYADWPEASIKPESAAATLQQMQQENVTQLTTRGGKVLGEKTLSLAGNPGFELQAEEKDAQQIYRAYLVGRRLYNLIYSPPAKKPVTPAALKALDSFTLLTPEDVGASIRKKIEEATPAPLPQEPAARRLTSDARDEGLKGKVKVIEEEDEDLSGTWSVQRRKPARSNYYNEQGNLTKSESYDYRGNPMQIMVYGYIDGMRANNGGRLIRYSYDPPPMAAPPGTAQKKRDTRYYFKFDYKYNEQGRLAERIMIDNDGSLWHRTVYRYGDKQKEELGYSRDGKLSQKHVSVLDANGHEVEQTYYDAVTEKVAERYRYEYEFDAQGNWVKRVTLKWSEKDGKAGYVPSYVSYRKITYYP